MIKKVTDVGNGFAFVILTEDDGRYPRAYVTGPKVKEANAPILIERGGGEVNARYNLTSLDTIFKNRNAPSLIDGYPLWVWMKAAEQLRFLEGELASHDEQVRKNRRIIVKAGMAE